MGGSLHPADEQVIAKDRLGYLHVLALVDSCAKRITAYTSPSILEVGTRGRRRQNLKGFWGPGV